MAVDERLDKLTARHEALTETVELMTNELHMLQRLVADIGVGTARLLHVAEVHERRISRLEGSNL